jgi:hypothetical protein
MFSRELHPDHLPAGADVSVRITISKAGFYVRLMLMPGRTGK